MEKPKGALEKELKCINSNLKNSLSYSKKLITQKNSLEEKLYGPVKELELLKSQKIDLKLNIDDEIDSIEKYIDDLSYSVDTIDVHVSDLFTLENKIKIVEEKIRR